MEKKVQNIENCGKDKKHEKGRVIHIGCTVAETNIQAPMDSNQLWDYVRALIRILSGVNARFIDHVKLGILDNNWI